PKLPADATTTGCLGPILPSPASPWTATHVPRPLNARIGLTVSTLTTTGTPSRALSASWTYCGEPVKTGSIEADAARIASDVSSGISMRPGPGGCPSAGGSDATRGWYPPVVPARPAHGPRTTKNARRNSVRSCRYRCKHRYRHLRSVPLRARPTVPGRGDTGNRLIHEFQE